MKQGDFLWHLIRSLSSEEKRMVKKYLQIFRNTKSVKIFEAYQKSMNVYHGGRIFHLTNIKSKTTFLKEKSKLKDRILTFLGSELEDQTSQWLQSTLQGIALRERGEYFAQESYQKLNTVAKESIDASDYIHTLIAWNELTPLVTSLSLKKLTLSKSIEHYKEFSVNKLYHNYYAEKFFYQVGSYYVMSLFVRSRADEDTVLTMGKSQCLNFEYHRFEHLGDQQSLLMIKIIYWAICNEIEKVKACTDELQKWTTFEKSIEYLNKYSNNRVSCYSALFVGYRESGRLGEFKPVIESFKIHLEKSYADKCKYASKWSRFFDYLYTYNLRFSKVEESDIHSIKELIENANNQLIPKLKAPLLLLLVRMNLKLKKYPAAHQMAHELMRIENTNDSAKEYKDWGRLLEMVCLFDQFIHINQKTSDDFIALSSISESHYRYYKRKDKRYYEFERSFCKFCISLKDHKKSEFIILLLDFKNNISELQKNDTYGAISKIQNKVFDFEGWIKASVEALM